MKLSKEQLIAFGLEAIGLCREAVKSVDEKRKAPGNQNYSPAWYENMKEFLERVER